MNRLENPRLMKNQTFGVEIEMAKITRPVCAKAVQEHFNQKYNLHEESYYIGGYYDKYGATDHKGRTWTFVSDGSSSGRLGSISCEMVTPILTYDDIVDLQEIVRTLRIKYKAVSNADYMCGVHIHVGINTTDGLMNHTAKSLRNLVNIVTSHEHLLAKAVGFSESVRGCYTKYMDNDLVETLNRERPRNIPALQGLHYRVLRGDINEKYDHSRYYFLNLHAIARHKTVEFRFFEFHKSMHAGELKSYIQLCLAMSNYAKMVAYASNAHVNLSNEKYAMKNWLVNMGLVDDEFKTCRNMLTKRLTGDTAYRNVRPSTITDDIDERRLVTD